ncbi:DUF4767 domain-containing protein [Pediococcus stilesii]|nr:DUF4767 domain-containing protein [Pediococcus stilesii]
MKKNIIVPIIISLVTLLSACSNQGTQSKNSDTQKSAPKTAQSFTAESSSEKSQETPTNHKKSVINFEQIKMGDYGSIAGDWKLIKATAKSNDITDSTQATLTVSKDSLTDGQVTINASGLRDSDGNHQLNYQKEQGALVAGLDDAAINYSIKFYPRGVTNEYNNGSKNLIVIWTSNNNYTEVFEQENSDADDSSSTSDKKQSELWNTEKDQKLQSFISEWSKTMNQDYQKYDGTNELEVSTGMSYPSDLANEPVKGQRASIGWSKDGKGSYEYNVVAIYNHNGTVPPLPSRITYCFAFHNGKPVVLVDQSRDGGGDFEETQNEKLNAGFDRIAKN